MAEKSNDGSRFPELFGLIEDYAGRDRAHQEKALRIIAVAYEGAPEAEGMPDARQAVDDILHGHDYVFPAIGLGALDPRSVDAVVRVALYQQDNRGWGIDRLSRMLQGLVRRLDAEGGYESYEEDTNVVMTGLRTVVTGVLVEEIVEDLEELAEEALAEVGANVLPPAADGTRMPPDAVPGEGTASSEGVPPAASTGTAKASDGSPSEGAAPIADRRQELMELLASAATPTEVAVARAAADGYLASDPSDGDVRMARDQLPTSAGE